VRHGSDGSKRGERRKDKRKIDAETWEFGPYSAPPRQGSSEVRRYEMLMLFKA
jgi:hypothetical protein